MTADAARLEDLAARHGPTLIAYLARRYVVREDAADLYQRVLVTTWRRLSQVPDGHEAGLCWMLAVARRELANARRGQRRRDAVAAALRQALATFPTADPGDPELFGVLARLRAADRELLLLTYWEGLDSAQAGAVLGISASTARKRLQRARERCAGHLRRTRSSGLGGGRAGSEPPRPACDTYGYRRGGRASAAWLVLRRAIAGEPSPAHWRRGRSSAVPPSGAGVGTTSAGACGR